MRCALQNHKREDRGGGQREQAAIANHGSNYLKLELCDMNVAGSWEVRGREACAAFAQARGPETCTAEGHCGTGTGDEWWCRTSGRCTEKGHCISGTSGHALVLLMTSGTLVEHNTYGALMEHLWNTYGALMEHLWNTNGTLMEHLWNTYGTLMEH